MKGKPDKKSETKAATAEKAQHTTGLAKLANGASEEDGKKAAAEDPNCN